MESDGLQSDLDPIRPIGYEIVVARPCPDFCSKSALSSLSYWPIPLVVRSAAQMPQLMIVSRSFPADLR